MAEHLEVWKGPSCLEGGVVILGYFLGADLAFGGRVSDHLGTVET